MTDDGKKQPDAQAEGRSAGGAPAPAAGREGRQPANGRNGDADGLQPRQAGRADGVKLGHGATGRTVASRGNGLNKKSRP